MFDRTICCLVLLLSEFFKCIKIGLVYLLKIKKTKLLRKKIYSVKNLEENSILITRIPFKAFLIFVGLIIIFFPVNLSAQINKINFVHILSENGLSQNTVHCILQDSQGFIWFATEDGLDKYDGYNFTVYKNDIKDSTSGMEIYGLELTVEDYAGLIVSTINLLIIKIFPVTSTA